MIREKKSWGWIWVCKFSKSKKNNRGKVDVHYFASARQLTEQDRSDFLVKELFLGSFFPLLLFSVFLPQLWDVLDLNSSGNDVIFFFPFLHFQIFQWLAWGGATIIGLIATMSSSLSETSEPLQPRSDFLLAFLKLLWLARGGRCVCLLITDWPKGCLHHLQGMKCLFWHTHKRASQPQNIHTLPLTHTDALSFFFSLDFYPLLCRSNTRLKITLSLTLGHTRC